MERSSDLSSSSVGGPKRWLPEEEPKGWGKPPGIPDEDSSGTDLEPALGSEPSKGYLSWIQRRVAVTRRPATKETTARAMVMGRETESEEEESKEEVDDGTEWEHLVDQTQGSQLGQTEERQGPSTELRRQGPEKDPYLVVDALAPTPLRTFQV